MLPSTLCGVAVSAYLMWQFGLVGGCWSLVVRNVISILCRLPSFLRAFSPVFGYLRLDRILACGAMMALLMWLLAGQREAQVVAWQHLLPGISALPWVSSLAAATVEASTGLAVYAAALLLLGVVGKADLSRLLRHDAAVEAG